MDKGSQKTKQAAALRVKAEKQIVKPADITGELSAIEIKKLLHELQVHQIELELQNDELRGMQTELAESQRKYADLYDFAPVGYFTLDKKGHILETNVTGAASVGAEKRTLIGQPFSRYILPDYISVFTSHLRKARESKTKETCILKLVRRDGGSFDAQMDTLAVAGTEETFDHFRSSVTDITALKKAELALQERTVQLAAANKDMEGFCYSISHDLRSPLRAIDGFTRYLLKGHREKFDEDAAHKFQVIRENVQKMGQLIDDLLAFSRYSRQTISSTALDMKEMVQEIWNEQRALHPDRRMEMRIDGLPNARGDRMLLRQVWTSLLDNAIKFTAHKEPVLIEVGGKEAGGEHIYFVKDNGIGFDMTYYGKLFGVFQRLHSDREYEGTGVGLAIVKQIVTRHGGRAWGEGKENEGATFYFSLPMPDKRTLLGKLSQ